MRLDGISWFDAPIIEGGFKFIGKYKRHIVASAERMSEKSLENLVYILMKRFPGNRVIVIAKRCDEGVKEAARLLGIKVFEKSGEVEVEEEAGESPGRIFARRVAYYALRTLQRMSPELKADLEAARQHYLALANLGKTSEVRVSVKVSNPPRELWPIASNYLDHMICAIFESLGYSYGIIGHGLECLNYEFLHADTVPKVGEIREDSLENSIITNPPEGWIIKKRLVREILDTGRKIFCEKWINPRSKTLLTITSTPFEYEATFSVGVYDPDRDKIVSEMAPLEVIHKKIPESERVLADHERPSFAEFIQQVKAKMAEIGSMEIDEPVRYEVFQEKRRGDLISP